MTPTDNLIRCAACTALRARWLLLCYCREHQRRLERGPALRQIAGGDR